jgi:DNA-3-methyladenine glycosylase I
MDAFLTLSEVLECCFREPCLKMFFNFCLYRKYKSFALKSIARSTFLSPPHSPLRVTATFGAQRPIVFQDLMRCPNPTTFPDMQRCSWPTIPLTIDYHDKEWGVPVHDDRLLFEFLILEGAQAGLSWTTVLKKREAYRIAFDNFEPEKVARYSEAKCSELLANDGIIRNRLKIRSAVQNARAFLVVQKEFGSFGKYIWRFVDGKPKRNHWTEMSQVPARTAGSDAMSKDLLKRDFKFVGSTICYAYMQATGMVNDHLVSCFRHAS